MEPSNGVTLGSLIAALGITVAASVSIITVLVRQILKSRDREIDQRFLALEKRVEDRFNSVDSSIANLKEARMSCEEREKSAIVELKSANQKVIDQYIEFRQSISVMEATRSNRLDALFKVIDKLKDDVRDVRSVMLSKLQELVGKAEESLMRELKLYIREAVQKKRKENDDGSDRSL